MAQTGNTLQIPNTYLPAFLIFLHMTITRTTIIATAIATAINIQMTIATISPTHSASADGLKRQ